METYAPHGKRFTGKIILFDEAGETLKTVDCNHHHAYYREILSAMEIATEKNNDYAGAIHEHPLANFLESQQSGIDPRQGLWLRMTDKIGRIKTFFKTGKLDVTSESVDDAFRDLGNYAFLMLALRDDQNHKKNTILANQITAAQLKPFTDPYDNKADTNATE